MFLILHFFVLMNVPAICALCILRITWKKKSGHVRSASASIDRSKVSFVSALNLCSVRTTWKLELMYTVTSFQWRMPCLVRLRSSPPLDTKTSGEMSLSGSLPSPGKAVASISLWSLARSIAAPRRAATNHACHRF